MATKKTKTTPAAEPASGPAVGASPAAAGMMPGGMPPMVPGPMTQNPMAMMQMMMQMMMGGGMGGFVSPMDPSAIPFSSPGAQADPDLGLDAEIIRPATLTDLVKTQAAVATGSVLDRLCLTEDGQAALGGLPKGCTIAFAGPPGKGKTRTALAAMARIAAAGERVAFIVAEEGFHDEADSGRDDLCSRLVKIGMSATGLDEKAFTDRALSNMYVLESQYHKGNSWDDFVTKYRYLVEKEEIGFVVVDSLNMLDPTKNRTADNLSALKTYNHANGITCLCIGQIKDSGGPVGGESLQHTADVVYMLEELTLGSKEIAEQWGGKYRDRIDIIRAVKSVTTPTFPHPVRVGRKDGTGELEVHADQPAELAVPEARG